MTLAKNSWANALDTADTLLDDAQMALLPGSVFHLDWATELAKTKVDRDPIYAAALLVRVAERLGLFVGEAPT